MQMASGLLLMEAARVLKQISETLNRWSCGLSCFRDQRGCSRFKDTYRADKASEITTRTSASHMFLLIITD